MPVRIFNVDRQVAERMEKSAEKEVSAKGGVQSERECQPCGAQRKGMHSVDQVLPKRSLIVLAPDHFFRKVVKVVLAQVEDDNRDIRKNRAQQDRKGSAGAAHRIDQAEVNDRMTWGLHRYP